MIIKELKLFTNKLTIQKYFFENVLGFSIINNNNQRFSIQIGHTKLTFEKSNRNHKYHYCFLIPSNKLDESITWLNKRLEIIKIENDSIKQKFESWNAESVYFYDGARNLAEFIVRYDLKNNNSDEFDQSQIISVNEIGMPTSNVKKINTALEEQLHTKFWKGDLQRFGTNGTQNGLFLLVNNQIKKNWFPTTLNTESTPFEATIIVKNKSYQIKFEKEQCKLI
jgi:catechol-2,3-dioxygenase